MKEKLINIGLNEQQAKAVMKLYEGSVTKEKFGEVKEENASLIKKTEELKEKNRELAAAHKAEITALKIDNAVNAALISAGAKNKKAVRALLETKDFMLDENGDVSGLEEQIKALKESDGYMFESAPKLKGVVPGESKDGLPGKSFDEMTYSEQMAYLATK